MSRSRLVQALFLGAALLGGCATPVASDPAASATTTPSSSAVAVANPTPVPTAMAVPTTLVTETGAPDVDSVPLVAGSVVKTLADDGLRVRSEPSIDRDSYKQEPLVPMGTPLLLLDGPVSGSGYEWYEIAPFVSLPVRGWVASGSREGEPWIEPAEFACPAAPTDMRSLLDLEPGVGVFCFPNVPSR